MSQSWETVLPPWTVGPLLDAHTHPSLCLSCECLLASELPGHRLGQEIAAPFACACQSCPEPQFPPGLLQLRPLLSWGRKAQRKQAKLTQSGLR